MKQVKPNCLCSSNSSQCTEVAIAGAVVVVNTVRADKTLPQSLVKRLGRLA